LPDRRLGRPAADLRGAQVRAVHDGREPPHAGRDPLLRVAREDGDRDVRLRVRPVPRTPSLRARAAPALRRVRARVRDQGAALPVPHLAPRRARRGADGRLGDPGRRAPQDGDVRVPPLRAAALPARGRRGGARHRCARGRGHRLRRARRDRAAGSQEARRVLVGIASRVRHARPLRAHADGGRGQRLSDAEPRPVDRWALPPRRHDLRATPHPSDRRLRRALDVDPGVRRLLPRDHAGVGRAPRAQRVRRRVPDPARRLRALAVGDGVRDERRHPGRALSPLDVRARDLRTARPRGERPASRSHGTRARRARPDRRPLPVDGPLSGPVSDAHAAVDRSHPRARRGAGGGRAPMIDTSAFTTNWPVALPGLVVAAVAMLVMSVDAVMRGRERDGLAVVSILGLGGAGAVAAWLWVAAGDPAGFHDTLRGDRYALFFAALLCVGSLLTVLMSIDYLREQPLPAGEYHALVLLSTSGMIFLAAANDLIVLFLALEIMSVAVYVLSGLLRREVRSTE